MDLVKTGDYILANVPNPDYTGIVFKVIGVNNAQITTEVVGNTAGDLPAYWPKGLRKAFNITETKIYLANEETLKLAGIKPEKPADNSVDALLDNLEAEAEAAKTAFCDEIVKHAVELAKRPDHLLVEAALQADVMADAFGLPKTAVVRAAKVYVDAVGKVQAAKIATK